MDEFKHGHEDERTGKEAQTDPATLFPRARTLRLFALEIAIREGEEVRAALVISGSSGRREYKRNFANTAPKSQIIYTTQNACYHFNITANKYHLFSFQIFFP